MWLESLLGVVAVEALVQLWFHAAPLQWLRRAGVRFTPFLYSKEDQTHLFNCPYCVSVWVGASVTILFQCASRDVFILFCFFLSVHRLSNFLHMAFSYLRDKQVDLRVARNNT